MLFKPFPYQKFAGDHILNNPHCGVFLDMGLGKTAITLTSFKKLLDELMILKPLIIATKRVAETVWAEECEKWDHLKHLKVIKVLGSEKERIAALQTEGDFHVINRENVSWLINYYKSKFPFDALIIDESSSFKSHKAGRFRSLKMIQPKLSRVVELTGTPAPNGYMDLWSQLYLLDKGKRLGENISEYRRIYFDIGKAEGHVVYKYNVKREAVKIIQNKISDICISMKTCDYRKDLPKVVDNVIKIKMPDDLKEQYKEFEKQQILWLRDQGQITAINKAALINKLLQFTNGQVYDEKKRSHWIHDLKIDALGELIEEANGQPLIVAYLYKHDATRIIEKYDARELKRKSDVDDWNAEKIPLLVCHPASAGHGLNLQYGGHLLCWYGMNWSLELTNQFDKRIDRPGQQYTVINNKLLLQGTWDEVVRKRLIYKDDEQNIFMDAIKARIKEYL
jgi:hypothetical protein